MARGDKTTKLRLYPKPDVLSDKGEIYEDLDLPAPACRQGPYVIINMVSSVDGRSAVAGKASGIGSRADRGAMRALRSRVDAVMVGAGTLRAEKLNLGLDDPEVGQPLAVVVGGAGELPLGSNLVRPPGQRLVLAMPQNPRPEGRIGLCAGRGLTTVLCCPGKGTGLVDLPELLRTLRTEHAVDRLLVEGGPGLNRALISMGLVDELFLTIAAKLLSGPEAAILSGACADEAFAEPSLLTLVSVHCAGEELFLRYRLDDQDR